MVPLFSLGSISLPSCLCAELSLSCWHCLYLPTVLSLGRLNNRMPGVMTPSNTQGGDTILHTSFFVVSILIAISREIRGWYRILTKRQWGVKPSLFSPCFGLQANDYILKALIICCKLVRSIAGWTESLTVPGCRHHFPLLLLFICALLCRIFPVVLNACTFSRGFRVDFA